MSRPPFHTVGILPFWLGTFLAWRLDGVFHPAIFIMGCLAVVLIMLSTYQAGEYFDHQEDRISKALFRSKFAGGSGVVPSGTVPREIALWTSFVTIFMAGLIGIALQFYYRTGPYTLLLGVLGAFPGFFYSMKPIRLVERGIGEIFIGFCYGWLPVASAFYIQTGYIHPIIHWIAMPIGLTIFNVIFLNEFQDYRADSSVGKRNMLVRMGTKAGMLVYILLSVLSWLFMFLSLRMGVPTKALYILLPVMIVSLTISVMMLARKYKEPKVLEVLCGLNIAVNLGTTASYILAYL